MTKRTCSIDGCEKPPLTRGWCCAHYNRWKNHGDPLAGRKTATGEPLRWLRDALAVPTDECLIWPYAQDQHGYGKVYFQGRSIKVCWVALILTGSPRPPSPGNWSLHSCPGGDNTSCVNPAHLRWGTAKDNTRDMYLRRSADHPSTRLTPEQVLDISNRDYSKHGTTSAVAREFGVTPSLISGIRKGRIWTSVQEPGLALG